MFSPINYNREFEITKKIYGEKGAKSVDKMITTKKINLSKMDEKLSLLNSDIEDLYKKYAEKKKIRQKKEKNEQNLVSRINFLIDEERKIRTKIENNPTKKEEKKIKIKSLKILNSPEIITNTGTIRYKTIESNDDKERDNINRFRHIGEKNKLYIKSYDEKDKRNITLSSYNSSIQNNTNENLTSNNDIKQNIRIKNYNNKNSNIPSNSNVTNNVCIIINNTEQNNALQNSSNNYFNGDLSFGKKENNNMNNTSDINISTTEKEKRKIHIEIQNIKLKLASKIKSLYKEKEKESNSENNEENKNINTNTPSLSMNKNSKYKGNKNGIRSLKNILNMKRKYLKNLNKEIDLKRINNNIKKRSVENKKKIMSFNINLNPDIDYVKDAYKKSSKEKIITKRSYSKPDNISNLRNNIQIINNHIDKNKSQISNKISNNKTLSIDSNEVILYDSNINNNNYITQIKTEKNTNENNLDYKSPSARTTIPISSLTFQQSIENKRKMLGLGLNIKCATLILSFSPSISTIVNCFFAVYLYCTNTPTAARSNKTTPNVIKKTPEVIDAKILGFLPMRSKQTPSTRKPAPVKDVTGIRMWRCLISASQAPPTARQVTIQPKRHQSILPIVAYFEAIHGWATRNTIPTVVQNPHAIMYAQESRIRKSPASKLTMIAICSDQPN